MRKVQLLAAGLLGLAATVALAKDERYQATVWADIDVDASGHAASITFPGKVAGTAIADNLQRQIATWQFEPAKRNGEPVAASTSLQVALDIDASGDQAKVTVADAIPSPRLVKNDPPRYPEDALRAKAGGVVWVEFVVGADGSVSEISTAGTAPKVDKRLVKAAVDCATKWQFKPESVDGVPVATRAKTTVAFWIGNGRPPANLDKGAPLQRRSLDALSSDPVIAESHLRLKTEFGATRG